MDQMEMFDELAKRLMEKNNQLTYDKARTWIEVLWEDFETTRAKAGHDYKGQKMTERIVKQWIDNYGPRLHEFVTNNPKYAHLIHNDTIH